MIPLKCPTCGLQWNVREDSPASMTCPMCLAAVANPEGSDIQSRRPLPVLPLEHEVKRDMHVGRIGIAIALVVASSGVVSLVAAGISGTRSDSFQLIMLAGLIAGSVAAVIITMRFAPSTAMSATGQNDPRGFTPGSVLDYQRPVRDRRKLSGGAFFAQAIGGIILGVCGIVAITLVGALPLLLAIPIGGIALLFVRRFRGLGLGLFLAFPTAALIVIGICSGFRF